MEQGKLRINYQKLAQVREAKSEKSTFLNINYELLAKVLEAKHKKLSYGN